MWCNDHSGRLERKERQGKQCRRRIEATCWCDAKAKQAGITTTANEDDWNDDDDDHDDDDKAKVIVDDNDAIRFIRSLPASLSPCLSLSLSLYRVHTYILESHYNANISTPSPTDLHGGHGQLTVQGWVAPTPPTKATRARTAATTTEQR